MKITKNRLSNLYGASLMFLLFVACNSNEQWKFSKEIKLNGIQPIGIVFDKGDLYLSDVENNRLVQIDLDGNILKEYDSLQRPMHFSMDNGRIFVPEYLTDQIKIIFAGKTENLALPDTLNAPGGVDVKGDDIAIADFYNHSIILKINGKPTRIGKEGHGKGQLYYPTDVEIFNDKIYVADAYNNRVQVFDKQGESLQLIGDKDSINTATGIAVTGKNIFVADFENNRILVYDTHGKRIQTLTEKLNKPTDIYVSGNTVYVANYKGRSVVVFEK